MTLKESPLTLQQTIAKHFDYSFDFEFLDLVADTILTIEDLSNEDQVIESADRSTIYYKDQWTILHHYCTPTQANWDYAFDLFVNDMLALAKEVIEEAITAKEDTKNDLEF